METKRKNWKRSRKRLCKLETGRKRKPSQHGNERLEKTVSRFHAGGWPRNLFRPIHKGSWTVGHRFSVSSINLISAY